MTQYKIGSSINVYSSSNPGEGAIIAGYEWKWDGIIIEDTSTLSEIIIDTTGQTEGVYTISLRILNDCGSWSSVYNEDVELVEEVCVPNWQCEVDSEGKCTGYKIDLNSCFESVYDSIMCPPGKKPPEEPSSMLFYIIVGGLGLLGLKLLSKKQES